MYVWSPAWAYGSFPEVTAVARKKVNILFPPFPQACKKCPSFSDFHGWSSLTSSWSTRPLRIVSTLSSFTQDRRTLEKHPVYTKVWREFQDVQHKKSHDHATVYDVEFGCDTRMATGKTINRSAVEPSEEDSVYSCPRPGPIPRHIRVYRGNPGSGG